MTPQLQFLCSDLPSTTKVPRQNSRDGLMSWAKRTIVCNWSDYPGIVNTIRGGTTIFNGYLIYTTSLFFPTAPFLYFDTIHIEGIPGETGLSNDSNNVAAYKYARLTITFKALKYGETNNGSANFETAIAEGNDSITIPGSAIQFSDNSQLLDASGQPIPFQRRYGVASIVITRFDSLIGNVNSTTFNVIDQGVTYPNGTVLFEGPRSQKTQLTTGNYNWHATFQLTYKSVGWNNALYGPNGPTSANRGKFEAVTLVGSGDPPYPTADLNPLYTALE